MIKSSPRTIEVPHRDEVTEKTGLVARTWYEFFRSVRDALDPLGYERSFTLSNNISSAINIDGLSFDYKKISQAKITYLIQRVTTGAGAQEKIETGEFYLVYKPTSNVWVLSNGPTTAGVTLSVTASGQVKYTTTNLTGDDQISRIVWRSQILNAKSSIYSEVGR